MYLVLGLGNPGPRYERTRHNAGFLAVDFLTGKHRIKLAERKFYSLCGNGEVGGCPVMVCKPMTYMNESGKSARSITAALRIPPENVIVVHDDIDIPFGKIKVKHKGGAGGQRGVLSIMEALRTDLFSRVRIGVGRPEHKDDIVDYVLSPFENGEWSELDRVIEQAAELVERTLREFNNRTKLREEERG
ncbi:MAG: aminoacyl-tRNA hydrolase [Nitrospinae bacterium]|nr:aminoacyl-tRNA hydrolase [Nitrospinota bacterium]